MVNGINVYTKCGIYLYTRYLNRNLTIVYLETLFVMSTKNYKSKERLSIIALQHKHCNGVIYYTFLLYLIIITY